MCDTQSDVIITYVSGNLPYIMQVNSFFDLKSDGYTWQAVTVRRIGLKTR